MKKEETKTNKRQCPLNSVQVKIREGSPEGIKSDYGGYGGKHFCERDEF